MQDNAPAHRNWDLVRVVIAAPPAMLAVGHLVFIVFAARSIGRRVMVWDHVYGQDVYLPFVQVCFLATLVSAGLWALAAPDEEARFRPLARLAHWLFWGGLAVVSLIIAFDPFDGLDWLLD